MKKYTLFFALFLSFTVYTQNLIDISSWTLGSGAISGFSINGGVGENHRIFKKGPQGNKEMVWEAVPDKVSGADGGWNSSAKNIDSKKKYRFSVWIKKVNSNDGITYFGCRSYNKILRLSGVVKNNPYFWCGDLPKLDRWYLLVGYIHPYNYKLQVHEGAMYDGVTGQKVKSIVDFKFHKTATKVIHRAYLYYDTNVDDRQYFASPRIDEVNGKEPSVKDLLRVNRESKIIFSYDVAGNQNQKYYCASSDNCVVPTIRKNRTENTESFLNFYNEKVKQNEKKQEIFNTVNVYPNPTNDQVNIDIHTLELSKVKIIIYNTQGQVVYSKSNNLKNDEIYNFSNQAVGVYYVKVIFNDGTSIIKAVIKK